MAKTRAARKSETDPRNLDEPIQKTPPSVPKERDTILPDITLSQLLTLGIDELANKLNVPVSKLNTMTLVELTTYLSDFIENTKKPATPSWSQDLDSAIDSPVFKVSFDDANDVTFVAKFDDNFGETNFVANFDHFESNSSSTTVNPPPTVDKYAMLREIIEKEIQPSTTDEPKSLSSSGGENNDFASLDFHKEVVDEMTRLSPNISSMNQSSQQNLETISPLTVPIRKIDTKITEAISHAKDRYAALRDIILVEDLFEKPVKAPLAREESSSFEDKDDYDDQRFDANFDDMEDIKSPEQEASPEINVSCPVVDEELVVEEKSQHDLEIDEFMRQAVSNLSLHSAGPSPALVDHNKSPVQIAIESASPNAHVSIENIVRATLNDMGTSPIPIAKSPSPKIPLSKSPMATTKSPGECGMLFF